ncbi:MAG: response regulator [Epsilonproteobacteria bacterium]|nr:response regulator [Campylobacterota bacterium]
MKYLVADDSKLARRVLKKSLCEFANEDEIAEACNGLEALKVLLQERLEIIFLDLTMPVMDGYEAIPKMLDINPDAKIIVVSADIQEKAKEKVLSLGAVMHVEKPINPIKMKEILNLVAQ